MMVWTWAVRSCEAAIQYRKGTGTETTHWRVGTQGMTHSTRWAAVWAMRRPAHEGQNPRRLQLKGSSNSLGSATQVMLAIRIHATVSRKCPQIREANSR